MALRRTPADIVANNVVDAMQRESVSAATLSQATGIQPLELRDRLAGRSPFTFSELLNVGGFLRSDPASLLVSQP